MNLHAITSHGTTQPFCNQVLTTHSPSHGRQYTPSISSPLFSITSALFCASKIRSVLQPLSLQKLPYSLQEHRGCTPSLPKNELLFAVLAQPSNRSAGSIPARLPKAAALV